MVGPSNTRTNYVIAVVVFVVVVVVVVVLVVVVVVFVFVVVVAFLAADLENCSISSAPPKDTVS